MLQLVFTAFVGVLQANELLQSRLTDVKQLVADLKEQDKTRQTELEAALKTASGLQQQRQELQQQLSRRSEESRAVQQILEQAMADKEEIRQV